MSAASPRCMAGPHWRKSMNSARLCRNLKVVEFELRNVGGEIGNPAFEAEENDVAGDVDEGSPPARR